MPEGTESIFLPNHVHPNWFLPFNSNGLRAGATMDGMPLSLPGPSSELLGGRAESEQSSSPLRNQACPGNIDADNAKQQTHSLPRGLGHRPVRR